MLFGVLAFFTFFFYVIFTVLINNGIGRSFKSSMLDDFPFNFDDILNTQQP